MKFHSRIHGERYPEAYPKKLDALFRAWAVKQYFPTGGEIMLTHKFEDDGVTHIITAMPLLAWKYRDHRVKKGEEALFSLGNRKWWTNRQVEHIDKFAFMGGNLHSGAYAEGEVEAGGYGDDWEHEAGDASGGPFF